MILMPPTIRNVATGHKIRRIDHDKIVRNYVSKIRSVGEANVTSRIVGKKTRHVAQRVNVADSRSISAELFPMELEVRMLLSADGTIKFQAFARDCENYLNAKEAEDAILKQTFPAPVAEAMIAGQDVNGELDLAVIFCDIVKFTALSQLISDAAALKVLDDLFTRFAGIRERLPWMDPIKTNYDEFMAVVGLSTRFPGRNLAEDAVRVALEMQRATRAYNADTGSDIEIRVGIDVGPAQVGLVGASGLKTFDIIGQTTVRASRAENTCDPGRVHITDSTFEMLGALTRDKFEPKKGGVNFKNMGRVATYMSL
jgi:class 3 adenylate cyclase